jgi:HSP20 family molecular chaperone IbpA
MNPRNLYHWMWADALSMLDEAERLHRHFARVSRAPREAPERPGAPGATWEPPVDIVETQRGCLVQVALPGADPGSIVVDLESTSVAVSALRPFPGQAAGARIHRIEIPYGRFERRIPLPDAALRLAGQRFIDGCLTLAFEKAGAGQTGERA